MGLVEELDERKVHWPPGRVTCFIPNGDIDELLTLPTIKAELINIYGSSMEGLDYYAKKIFNHGRKLFTILLWINFEGKGRQFSICTFLENGITDADLPFHPVVEGSSGSGLELCIGRSGCRDSGRHAPAPVLCRWKSRQRFEFYRDQWIVLAPVFLAEEEEGKIPHFDFEKNVILPFRKDYEDDPAHSHRGGYSHVWPVRIVAEHQNIYQPKGSEDREPLLAVKQLNSGDEAAFKREGDMLYLITTVKHKHLVRLLATYGRDGKHHLLFPFAEANLRTFWEAIPRPNWNRATYLWVLDQMSGLASALTAIHQYDTNPAYKGDHGQPGPAFSRFMTAGRRNVKVTKGEERYGRHGDIKPDNMLWRAVENDPKSHGILIITDLGLGEFRGQDSRSKINPNNLGGSQTYIAPEFALGVSVSRAIDIWALGCVYLEFITWLLTGLSGLERFHESRNSATLEAEVEDDAYFNLLSSSSGKYAVIRPAVMDCMNTLRRNKKCSGMIRDLLDLVEGSMLVVDPTARISAEKLHLKLWNIHHYSMGTGYSGFLAGSSPEDEGKGLIAPKRPSL